MPRRLTEEEYDVRRNTESRSQRAERVRRGMRPPALGRVSQAWADDDDSLLPRASDYSEAELIRMRRDQSALDNREEGVS